MKAITKHSKVRDNPFNRIIYNHTESILNESKKSTDNTQKQINETNNSRNVRLEKM